ncbi:GH36-type glycosyl hydrolase domain-containing protein [Roseateles cellulosilyticus]|uniref:Carbohydrate-binding protein n=1 Tax=Pelomonas cellulosilytica TaxID=2906762 RepID=A0ABS8XU40_9BURK|nr:glucoamylase family protein [Pelomonas sp. P8]MCE4554733.1 carbohydrate-binding protein [Pelomonas sp. P8]
MAASPPASSATPLHDLTPGGAATGFLKVVAGPDAAAPAVRAVQFGAERFAEHGRSLAAAQRVEDDSRKPRPFFPRLRSNLQVWGASLDVLAEHGLQPDSDAAHAWLLDNARLVQQQLDEVLHDLPRSYFQRLPRLKDEPLQGLPRVYGVAWAWVAHADSSLDMALMTHYLAGHHEAEALTLRELWALPSTLRVVLVENLRRLAERAAWRHLARRAAQSLFEALPQLGPDAVQRQLADWQSRWPHDPAITALAIRLHERLVDRALAQPDEGEAPKSQWVAARAWVDGLLPDPAAAQAAEQSEGAADHQSIRNAIGSLRRLGAADWSAVFETVHPALKALDRIDVYREEDDSTQGRTVHAIEALAACYRLPESDIAQVLRLLCSDPAWAPDAAERAPLHWLTGRGRPQLLCELRLKAQWAERAAAALHRHRTPVYLLSLAVLGAAALSLLLALGLAHDAGWPMTVVAALLAALPASEAVVALANRLISEGARPLRLARLAWPGGIPPAQRTLVVIPCMLTRPKGIQTLLAQLERHHLANLEAEAQFALLSDFADAKAQHLPDDAALLAQARAGIDALNERHCPSCGGLPRFLLLHRERRWCETEQKWIGWERKRGKTEALITRLAGLDAALQPDQFIDLGALSEPAPGIRHLVTLDSDTALPPGTLRELVAIAAHPLNRPRVVTSAHGAVTVRHGHGMLQPRIATPLATAAGSSTVHGTWFHSLFAGQPGLDPYSTAASEVYQDLFDEGSATGKGLIDVQAAAQVLAHRLPKDQVLSHDLLEGSLMRCAGVSDVQLVEAAPMHADVAASRIHRWTRGDWQLLPFIAHPRRWGLRTVHVWKMLDNLRRSLVAPASLLLLVTSWLGFGLSPGWALAAVAAAFGAGPLMGALAACAPARDRISLPRFYRHAAVELARAVAGTLWHLALLPAATWLQLDAIGRAMWRQRVSRRHLLEWTTADAAEAAARIDWLPLWRQHQRLSISALVLATVLVNVDFIGFFVAWPVALPMLAAWLLSPMWIALASRPRPKPRRESIDDDERHYLLTIARDTWRWFERWVTKDDNDLPPDNVQFDPDIAVAHRTSPTNIGLYLLSACCAREFGWLHDVGLAERVQRTLDTLDRLPRHRGHFYNWIETQRLAVLEPHYVSTVDSGNLCAFLLVVASACESFARGGDGMPPPPDVADALNRVATRARAMALEHDFAWLYDTQRRLLHIGAVAAPGVEPGDELLDQNHYDLLCSEARLASLVGIAKGDLPASHWGALGRPFFSRGRVTGLKSWSGSMFEMLMPSLVLDEPAGSALEQAARATVMEQIRAGRGKGVPWGVSESAYAKRDETLAFQYGPQGNAALALRDTPADEQVVAPYATVMAAMVFPRAAVANLRQLQALGARHELGFMEALDYTASRQPEAAADTPAPRVQRIGTTMAHHHGMSLVALTEVLCGGAPQRWADAEPRLSAVRWLLHERAPHEVPPLKEPPVTPTRATPRKTHISLVVPDTRGRALPATSWLGHGRLSAMLRENGAGTLLFGEPGQQVLVSRWHDDLAQDLLGHHLHLRDLDQPWRTTPDGAAWRGGPEINPWRSLTLRPTPGPQWRYSSRLHPASAQFTAEGEQLHAHTEVWVAVEDDVELRRVTLRNLSDRERRVALVSSFEPVLAPARADLAHPAFGKLFLQARWAPEQRALHWQRLPRGHKEAPVYAVHALVGVDPEGGARLERVAASADRAHWLARGGRAGQPGGVVAQADAKALFTGQAPGLHADAGALDTGNDPLSLLHAVLTLPPGARVTLTYATAAAPEAQTLNHMLDKLAQAPLRERALMLAHTMAGVRTQGAGLAPGAWRAGLALQTLLTSQAARDGVPALEGSFNRDALWRHGISGDAPIITIRVADTTGVMTVRELCALLQAQASPQALDIVVLDAEPASYLAPVSRALRSLAEQQQRGRAKLHVLSDAAVQDDTRFALNLLARVRWFADGRPLAQQLERIAVPHEQAAQARRALGATPVLWKPAEPGAATPPHDFDTASGACRFTLAPRSQPPRPWVNVIANEHFGCQVSERGAGMAWAGNSRLHQITPWSNDALLDTPGEWLVLHCLDSGCAWLLGRASAHQLVSHLPGATAMAFTLPGLVVRLRWTVDAEAAVRQCQVELHAAPGTAPRRLRLLAGAQWQLGMDSSARRSVVTRIEAPAGTSPDAPLLVLATQADGLNGFGGQTAWMTLRPTRGGDVTHDQLDTLANDHALWPWPDEAGFQPDLNPPRLWNAAVEASGDRRLLFDDEGRLVMPHALDGQAGPGTDAAALLAVPLRLEAGHAWHATVLLGHAPTLNAARELARSAWDVDPLQRLAGQRAVWQRLSAPVQVATPDAAFDALVNHWLPTQVLACRIWGRAGFYQAGGAFGFRDQLQDAMALVQHAPERLAEQIRRHTQRQFREGDVQHWWHEPAGAGVRTHFADDRLWLALALALYTERTGDTALADEALPFIDGKPVPEGAEDIYETPAVTSETASVYEHAARSIDISLPVGAHGLPFFGTGDWNDGMNRVGAEGRGESVWMGFFLCAVIDALHPLAVARGEQERAQRWRQAREKLSAALDAHAWDGDWYRRGWFDDGSVLGTHTDSECRIDLIVQAWAVLTGAASDERAQQALDSAWRELHDRDSHLLRLLWPPLKDHVPEAGYIQAYPGGVRENGGQYNHAATWALMASARLGQADRAWAAFTAISPAHRAGHGATYGLEPFAVAGDIETAQPHAGRGGWSWYTGAAGWLLRAAVESICGVRLAAGRLTVQPCLPPHWSQARVRLEVQGRRIEVMVQRAAPAAHPPAGYRRLAPGTALVLDEAPGDLRLWVPAAERAMAPRAEAAVLV